MTQTPILYFKRGQDHIGNEEKIQHDIQDHNHKYHLAHLAHALRNFNTFLFIIGCLASYIICLFFQILVIVNVRQKIKH